MTRINVDLSDLLAPIKQMREEIQKMNDALRATVQLQSQMAAANRSGRGAYPDTNIGLASQIRDLAVARGAPLPNNVYSIGSGSPIPPSNINPTGSSLGQILPSASWQLNRGGIGIAQAFAGQAGFQNDLIAKREREEAIKTLSSSTNTASKVLLDLSKRIEQERAAASETLKRATEEYGKASEAGAKDLAKFAKELDQAAKNFNKVNQKAEQFATTLDDFIKQGGPKGPDGPDGPKGFRGWWERNGPSNAQLAGGALVAAGMGMKLYGAYQGMQAVGTSQLLSAYSEIPSNVGAAQSLAFQRYMTQVAPTTGMQMVEAFGNLLTPGQKPFKFLGINNRKFTERYGQRVVEEERTLSEQQADESIFGAAGSAAIKTGIKIGGAGLAFKMAKPLLKQVGKILLKGGLKVGVGALESLSGVGLPLGLATAAWGAYDTVTDVMDLYKTIQQTRSNRTGKEKGGAFGLTGGELLFGEERAAAGAALLKTQAQTENILSSQQAQRRAIDAELQTIRARKLAMGLDENLAAYRMQTAATAMAGGAAVTGFEVFKGLSPERAAALSDRYAKLGYSIPEIGNIYNTYAGMMGTTKGAGALVGLSRAGVGSVEQLASNVLGISAVSGKQGDTKQLENVLAKAFEAGLKGAPSIQRFSQAAMEMSSALKIQSATGAANILSAITAAMAGRSGSPLMYMEEAKTGLAGLAAATGARSGLMGGLKVLSAASQGLGLGSMGLAAGSNVVQVQEAMSQLSGKVGDYTKLTGLARQLVGAEISGGLSPEQAIKKVRETLKAQAAAQTAPFAAGYRMATGGKDLAAVQAEAAKLFKAGKKEELRNLLFKFKGETEGLAGLEAEGAAESLLLMDLPAADAKKGKQILAMEKAKGAAKVAADFSTVQYKKILNQVAIDANKGINAKVTEKDLLETAQSLGLKGTPAEQMAQLRQAAGIGKGEEFTFSKLSGAMSTLANKEGGIGGEISILQDIGDAALNKLAAVINGTLPPSSPKNFSDKPSVNGNSVPIDNGNRRGQGQPMRTKSGGSYTKG